LKFHVVERRNAGDDEPFSVAAAAEIIDVIAKLCVLDLSDIYLAEGGQALHSGQEIRRTILT
jgi:hypothetical protein